MTSIKNYESVELPETPVKEKKGIFDFAKNIKGKKFSFKLRKRHIAAYQRCLMFPCPQCFLRRYI